MAKQRLLLLSRDQMLECLDARLGLVQKLYEELQWLSRRAVGWDGSLYRAMGVVEIG